MLEEFIQKSMVDEKIGLGLRKALEDENAKDKVQALIAYGKECGYDFSAEEVKEYVKKANSDEAELSDDELGAVAGGSKKGAKKVIIGYLSVASAGTCFISEDVRDSLK